MGVVVWLLVVDLYMPYYRVSYRPMARFIDINILSQRDRYDGSISLDRLKGQGVRCLVVDDEFVWGIDKCQAR